MLATKRKIETEQDRLGGFSSRMTTNRDIFASSVVEAPSYDTDFFPSTGAETIGEQVFEVEKEYKIDQPVIIDDEIQPIKTFMPTVQKKTKAVIETQEKVKVKINARGKIMVAVYSCIIALLAVFAIYNAFSISNLNSTIAQKENAFVSDQETVLVLENQLSNMTTENNIKSKLNGNFREAQESDKVYLNHTEKTEVPVYNQPTNLFDKICVFLSNLFN